MRITRNILYLVFIVLKVGQSQIIPENPCPQLFQYKKSDGIYHGIININQDFTGNFNLMVNVSLATYLQNGNVQLQLLTPVRELMLGQNAEYRVNFPLRDILPKLTQISFNRNILCYGPPEPLLPGSGITNFWAENRLHFSNAPTNHNNHPHNNYPNNNQITTQRPPPAKYPICLTCTERPRIPTTRPVTFTVPLPSNQNPFLQIDSEHNVYTRATEKFNFPSPTPSNVNRNSIEERCGLQNDHFNLIYQGNAVQEGEFPWLVALFFYQKPMKYTFQCTCNLISERHVITAGHCIQYEKALLQDKENIILVMGKHNLENWVAGGEIRNVKSIHVHPGYKQGSGGNDLVIFTLVTPVSFHGNIKPVCLWSGDSGLENVVKSGGTVVGWGESTSGEIFSSMPNKIDLPVVTQEDCLRSHTAFLQLTSEDTFCGGSKNNSGPCRGDSGAGFVMKINGRYFLRGLVAYSLASSSSGCDLNNYIVFADIGKKMNWVTSVLNTS